MRRPLLAATLRTESAKTPFGTFDPHLLGKGKSLIESSARVGVSSGAEVAGLCLRSPSQVGRKGGRKVKVEGGRKERQASEPPSHCSRGLDRPTKAP